MTLKEAIRIAEREGTAAAWREAYWFAPPGGEYRARCRRECLAAAERENTVAAWREAYWITPLGGEAAARCRREWKRLEMAEKTEESKES